MGAYSSDAPDAPNIAGANEAGVWADAETLGARAKDRPRCLAQSAAR